MKKLSIFLLGALAFTFTSCEDGPSEVPVQSNPQGPILEVGGVAADQNPESNIVDLKALADAGKSIALANVTVNDIPEGYTLVMKAEISKTEDFASYASVPTTMNDNVVMTTPDDLENAYVSSISKSPAAKDIYIRFAPYAVSGTAELRIGGIDHFIGPFVMNVTPYPSDLKLEQNYYLVGTACNWQIPQAIKFDHSDASPYDDPIYTLVVDITQDQADAGWWWKIIPQSTFEAGDWVSAPYAQFGTEEDGDESMSGILFASHEEDGVLKEPYAGVVYEYGTFMITLDMVEGTYNIQLAVPALYVQGDAAGWNWDSPLVTSLTSNDYVNYYGFAKCSTGGYKFTSEKSWTATFNLGMGEASTPGEGWSIAGSLINGGNDNIFPSETGLYWHHVNLPALTFESMYISTLGVIGNATPGGWDVSTALTPSEDCLVWEGDVEFTADGEWKIRANDAWTLSFGDNADDLVENGGNMPSPGAGTKHVVLDLSSHPYTITVK
ncbi:MAG: hypothetical protein NC230_10175 [Bacteroides sp.]|nr:hypothetical protein [Bacteroides sp.]